MVNTTGWSSALGADHLIPRKTSTILQQVPDVITPRLTRMVTVFTSAPVIQQLTRTVGNQVL